MDAIYHVPCVCNTECCKNALPSRHFKIIYKTGVPEKEPLVLLDKEEFARQKIVKDR